MIVKEFREFAMRGNVIDLAIGVVVGAAFGKTIKAINRLKSPPVAATPVAPVSPPRQEVLLEEIRDLLKTSQPR